MKARRLLLLSAMLAAAVAVPASAYDNRHGANTWWLVNSVTAKKIHDHLERLQRIANRNDGNRSVGTDGYAASVRYVVDRMRRARYHVTVQPFIADLFEEKSTPVLERVDASDNVIEAYTHEEDFLTLQYSGAGDETENLFIAGGIVNPPDPEPSSESGCFPDDFVGASGLIALVQRGGCDFAVKAANAAGAGAVGLLIFNEGQEGRTDAFSGTLGGEADIPVVGTTFAVGDQLMELAEAGTVRIHLAVDAETTPTETYNVLAEKRGRERNQDVVVGAHLDSVPEGPGINDNGSGTATLLTIAEQLAKFHVQPRNTVRFAFWGAEEAGLFGSTYYVENLTPEQRAKISLNLNFDMLGSPNFVRFVYDGDGTLGEAGPPGSGVIEKVFTDFFRKKRLASEPTEFDGRSDYLAFIDAGIPAGGLFSGAEGIKTEAQERRYGGEAGEPYDACYHEECDDISNLSRRSLDQLGKAAAHAVATFIMKRENIRPPAPATATALATSAARSAEYRGRYLVR